MIVFRITGINKIWYLPLCHKPSPLCSSFLFVVSLFWSFLFCFGFVFCFCFFFLSSTNMHLRPCWRVTVLCPRIPLKEPLCELDSLFPQANVLSHSGPWLWLTQWCVFVYCLVASSYLIWKFGCEMAVCVTAVHRWLHKYPTPCGKHWHSLPLLPCLKLPEHLVTCCWSGPPPTALSSPWQSFSQYQNLSIPDVQSLTWISSRAISKRLFTPHSKSCLAWVVCTGFYRQRSKLGRLHYRPGPGVKMSLWAFICQPALFVDMYGAHKRHTADGRAILANFKGTTWVCLNTAATMPALRRPCSQN